MATSKGGFMYHLSMAACEWFLIFLMFLDAALAFLLAKFAHYCELQSPCIFCLRLDHVFGNEKARSYLSLFCHKHRAEVSDLIACELHGKLADVREMCDDCFMSIMNCKIVGGKGCRKSYLSKDFVRSPSSCGRCSCCETHWKPKPNVKRLQTGSVRLGPAKVTMKPPLPRVQGRGRFRRRNYFKRARDKISGNSTPYRIGSNIGVNKDMDMLSDSGCVRFNSDSECEIPVSKHVKMGMDSFYSDSDSDSDSDSESESEIPVSKTVRKTAVFRKKRGSKDQTRAIHNSTSGQKQDQIRAKRFHSVSDHETSTLRRNHNEITPILASFTSKDPIGHGPKELNHVEHHSRDVSLPSKGSIGHVELHSREVSLPLKGSIQDSMGHVEHHSRDVSLPSKGVELHSRDVSLPLKGSIQDSTGHVELHSRDVSLPSIPREQSSTSRGSIQDSIGHVEFHSRGVSLPPVPQEQSSTSRASIQDSIGHVEFHPRGVSLPPVPQEQSSTSRGSIQDSIGHVEFHPRGVSLPPVPQEQSSTSRGSIQDSIGHVEFHPRGVSLPPFPQEQSSTSRGIQDSTEHLELHSRGVFGPSVPQDSDGSSDERLLSADEIQNENGSPEASKNERSPPSRGSIHDLPLSTDIKRDLSKFDELNDDKETSSSSSDKSDGFESLGSSVGDIEGETVAEKLKRQVDYDREQLHLLRMELEEERSAAAIAADEAMAMITRLQEEKAALHMEALQYLRMMDEQAEYDMEALDKANDLVSEKDKEIQDLEAELEYYRSRYDEELMMGKAMVETDNFLKNHLGNGKKTTDVKISKKAPVLDLQDEKRYILQCLSDLERKFNQVSSDQHTSIGKSNGNIENLEDFHSDNGNLENLEDFHSDCGTPFKHKDSLNGSKKVDVDTLENEISDLNERLEALEADRDFLEHACNTLQANGGIEFIQEIAHHLQDLRKIRFDRRCQPVA